MTCLSGCWTYFFQLRFSGLRKDPLGLCAMEVPAADSSITSCQSVMGNKPADISREAQYP
jgi:hypothetical protein